MPELLKTPPEQTQKNKLLIYIASRPRRPQPVNLVWFERVALFFCCLVVWLLGCWVVGLLGCWVVGLLGCVVIQNLSQISPKGVPKGSQMGSKWVPKRVPRGPYDLGRSWGALGNFCARIFGALGSFWVPFWGPVGSRGGPKIQLLGPNRHKRLQNGVPEGGPENVRKLRGNRVPK